MIHIIQALKSYKTNNKVIYKKLDPKIKVHIDTEWVKEIIFFFVSKKKKWQKEQYINR